MASEAKDGHNTLCQAGPGTATSSDRAAKSHWPRGTGPYRLLRQILVLRMTVGLLIIRKPALCKQRERTSCWIFHHSAQIQILKCGMHKEQNIIQP